MSQMNKDDSDDDGFPKHGGEALQIDNEFDDSEEEKSEEEEEMQQRPAMQINSAAGKAGGDAKPGDVQGARISHSTWLLM